MKPKLKLNPQTLHRTVGGWGNPFYMSCLLVATSVLTNISFAATKSISSTNTSLQVLQKRVIKGVIRSKAGEPVVDASIVLKGTNLGTKSSSEGMFRMEVSSNVNVLVVSHLSYHTQEIIIPTSGELNIELLPLEEVLEEVVVTSFGIQ